MVLDARVGEEAAADDQRVAAFPRSRFRPVALTPTGGAGTLRFFVRTRSRAARKVPDLVGGQSVLVRCVVRHVGPGIVAVEVLDLTRDGDPLTPEEAALLARAERLLRAESHRAAEKVFRELLSGREIPADAELAARLGIGRAAIATGRWAEAAEALARAIRLDPSDETARDDLARVEQELENETAAAAARQSTAPPALPGEGDGPPPRPGLAPPR